MEIFRCDADRAREIMARYTADDLSTGQFYGLVQEWIAKRSSWTRRRRMRWTQTLSAVPSATSTTRCTFTSFAILAR